MALPAVTEQDHHGFPSYRVRGKIFATAPDDAHLNVMIEADEIRAVAAETPGGCEELWWGKRLAAVRVTLEAVDERLLGALLTDAWRRKAPATLRRSIDRP